MFNNWTSWPPDWVIFAALAVAGAAAVIVVLVTVRFLIKKITRGIRRGCRAIHFRLVFGLWPSKDPLMRKIAQASVDEGLQRLGEQFRELCRQQEDLGRRYSCSSAVKDPQKDFLHARDIKWKLWWAKKKFYRVCDTAKAFGFAVQRKEVGR